MNQSMDYISHSKKINTQHQRSPLNERSIENCIFFSSYTTPSFCFSLSPVENSRKAFSFWNTKLTSLNFSATFLSEYCSSRVWDSFSSLFLLP